MVEIKLDISPQLFQEEIRMGFLHSQHQEAEAIIRETVIGQLESKLDALVISEKILRYKVEWVRPSFRAGGTPPVSLSHIVNQTVYDLGFFYCINCC